MAHGVKYKVCRVVPGKMPLGDGGMPLLGCCNYDDCTIWLNRSLGPEACWHTFIHEVAHACGEECGTQHRIGKYIVDDEHREEVIEDIIRTWMPAVQLALSPKRRSK